MGIPTYREMRDAAAEAMREKAAAAALEVPSTASVAAAATGGAQTGEPPGLREAAAAGVPTGRLEEVPEQAPPGFAQEGHSTESQGHLAHPNPEAVSLLEVSLFSCGRRSQGLHDQNGLVRLMFHGIASHSFAWLCGLG